MITPRSTMLFKVAFALLLLAAPRCMAAEVSAAAALANGGFESKLEPWTLHVYGAPAAAEFDFDVKHGGGRSLRLTSTELSDAALGQEIRLPPKQWYRFSGWVRTAKIEPRDATVYGTFQVQLPEGRGVLAAGANHSGDTDWTEVMIVFRAPDDGRVRIAPFFAGYGKGTGTVWFDDLSLTPIDLSHASARISREPLNAAQINPFQYGQFIEYLCDSVPAIWAEKLYDGSFEGPSPYRVEFLKQTDFREQSWVPSGATNRAEYVANTAAPISGKVAQEINATGESPCVVGVSQSGIAVQKGEACVFSCYFKQEKIAQPIEVLIHHEGEVIASAKFEPTSDWKKYSVRLLPTKTDDRATLSVRFTGPGRLWLDNASLMPEKTIGGWRPDAVEALRAMKPGIIRFGGTALEVPEFGDFEWRNTLGDPDRRPPFRSWGGLQPTGPGLEEFVQLCREVHAEPLMCVRTSDRGPHDAADEVEYFNGDAQTPMGRLRAENGHPEPYGIKYWQIGNERGGAEYEAQISPFGTAMRKVDPSIRLLSSYPSKGVLKRGEKLLNYVCPHQYDCANIAGAEAELLSVRDLINRVAPGKNIKVAVTEWNTTAGDFGPNRAKLWTLENALAVARYHNMIHRHCDIVEIANRSNLSNSFCSGVIQTDNHRLYKTPAYYAQQLYATLAGARPLKIESDISADAAPDMSATLSEDGAVVTLLAVNFTTEAVTRPLDFSGFGNSGQEVAVWTLADRDAAGQPDVTNSFGDPERIASVRSSFRANAGHFDYHFPALSLTVLQWKVGE